MVTEQMPHPTLEVFGWDEQGEPRLLRQTKAVAQRPPGQGVAASRGVDARGYAYTLHETAHACPWGTALILCRRAQQGFWNRWSEALATHGLETHGYIAEELLTDTRAPSGRWPTLPQDVVQFAAFRCGIPTAEAMRQARALYAATLRIIGALDERPLAAFMWGHSEHWDRAPALACRAARIPTLHAEGAMFPRLSRLEHGRQLDGGHAIINRGGQYYEDFSDIDRLWDSVGGEPLTPVQAARIEAYMAAWRTAKASKYGQPTEPPSVGSTGKRVLFVPLQIDRDASLFYATDKVVGKAVDLVELAASSASPIQWQIVAKRHPHDASTDAPLRALEARHEHLTVTDDANIHDLLAMADCVCGINSTVLMEALCYGKPVIALGSSCFSGRGFTFDIRDRASLRRALGPGARRLHMTDQRRRRFRRFLHMMMWEGNGGNGFFVDIDNFDAARLVEG
ncbi:MAG: hypothetical protein PVH68_10075 [Armatimonadota bacterium]|jgi:hypothetical protein